jgi:hypothetical protein
MKVKINELEQVLNMLLTELREQNGAEIAIEKEDFYWAIPQESLYNPYEKPQELMLGQLSDDLEHLHKLATHELPTVRNDFVKLSAIFQMIGYKDTLQSYESANQLT